MLLLYIMLLYCVPCTIYGQELLIDNYFIGNNITLHNPEAKEKSIYFENILSTSRIFSEIAADFQNVPVAIFGHECGNIIQTLVFDTIDSKFTTKLRKIIPGGNIEQISENTYIDFDLFIHQAFHIEHHPSKVLVYCDHAVVIPIGVSNS